MADAYIVAGLKEWQESLEKKRDALIELDHKAMQEYELLKVKYNIATKACQKAEDSEIYYDLYVEKIETEMKEKEQLMNDTHHDNRKAIDDLNILIKNIEDAVEASDGL